MFNIGVQEIIIIVVLALIVFGPKKLPKIGKVVGSSIREFKRTINEIQRSIENKSCDSSDDKNNMKSSNNNDISSHTQ